jgi:serine/threonine protein kinase
MPPSASQRVVDALRDRVDVVDRIGKGAYGEVFAATCRRRGCDVAVKCVPRACECALSMKRAIMEMHMARYLRHPNLAGALCVGIVDDPAARAHGGWAAYLVSQRMDCDLGWLLAQPDARDGISAAHVRVVMLQLLAGLAHMHGAGVMHRDVKPENVLVDLRSCWVKLGDFGLARAHCAPGVLGQQRVPVVWSDYVVTRHYRAPELLGCFHARYTPAVDVWSAGCIFGQLLLRRVMFRGCDAISMLAQILRFTGRPSDAAIDGIANAKARAFLRKQPPRAPQQPRDLGLDARLDADAFDLLRRLLAFDAAGRITAAQALQHPYFADADLKPMLDYLSAHEPPPAPGSPARARVEAVQAALDALPHALSRSVHCTVGRAMVHDLARAYDLHVSVRDGDGLLHLDQDADADADAATSPSDTSSPSSSPVAHQSESDWSASSCGTPR